MVFYGVFTTSSDREHLKTVEYKTHDRAIQVLKGHQATFE